MNFIQVCNRLGLDPFAKQIYLIRRWDKRQNKHIASVQVSIDGFRVVAERSRKYRGQTMPEWCGPDGVWRDVWLSNEPPAAARVGVWREGNREPLYRVALWRSYAQQSGLWNNMPEVMLLKCAEAAALRAAFPNDLGGIYTTDEMEQANGHPPPPAIDVAPEAFPLVSTAGAAQAPQEARLEPEPAERRPAVVVPFRAAQAGATGVDPVARTALDLFGPKLRARQTAEDLVDWMRQVIAHGFEPVAKRALFALWEQHTRRLGHDPNVLLARAKGGK
jgi:phage recombination protein Bet